MINLKIDDREGDKLFISAEKLKQQEKYNDFSYIKERLVVGDIVFKNLIVEHKTLSDFIGSVWSEKNHLFKQMEVLSNAKEEGYKVFLLITGNLGDLYIISRYRKKKFLINDFLAVCSSVEMKYGVSVFCLDTQYQMLQYIIHLCRRCDVEKDKYVGRLISKRNDKFINQLMVCNGISFKKAKVILEVYTPYQLYSCKEEDLTKINGIGKQLALSIKDVFNIKGEKT